MVLTTSQKLARSRNRRTIKKYGTIPTKSIFLSKYRYRKSRKYKEKKAAYPLYASLPGFQRQVTVNMPYHMEFTTSSSSITYNTFNSNDIYDPDLTGSGHQPRSHDQYALYYKYYRVNACKINVMFFWEETPSQSHTVGMYIDDNSSFAYSSTLDLYEKTGFKLTRPLLPDRASSVVITKKLPMSRLTAGALKDQRTLFGSAPTLKGPYIHIWTVPNNVSGLSYGAVRCHVELVFSVSVFEPMDIAGS